MLFRSKRDRLAYISALEKAQTGGSKDDYWQIITRAVSRALDIYLKAARGEAEEDGEAGGLLKIGALARQVGERKSTIRYWTRQGLLEVAQTTAAGYQLYTPEMVERIKQIHKLKKQRLTLQEIRKRLEQ